MKKNHFNDAVGILVFFGALVFSVVVLLKPYLFIVKPIVEALAMFNTYSTSGSIIIFTLIVAMTLGAVFIAIPYYLSIVVMRYLKAV